MSEVKRWRIPKILYPCYAPVSETDEVVPAAAYDALKLARDTAEDRIVDLGNRCIKAEAERDKAQLQREHFNQQMIRLGCEKGELYRQYCDLESERDTLRRACDEKERIGDAFLVRAEKAEAERDALAARCQRQTDTLDSQAKMIVEDRYKHTQIYVRNTELVKEIDKLAGMVARVRAVKSRHKHSEYAIALLCELGIALADPVEEPLCGIEGCTNRSLLKMHHGYGKCAERRGTTGFDARGRRHMESGFEVKIRYSRFDRRKAQRRKV